MSRCTVHVLLGAFFQRGIVGAQGISIYTTLLENAQLAPKVVGLITAGMRVPIVSHPSLLVCETSEFDPPGVCIVVLQYSFGAFLIFFGVKHSGGVGVSKFHPNVPTPCLGSHSLLTSALPNGGTAHLIGSATLGSWQSGPRLGPLPYMCLVATREQRSLQDYPRGFLKFCPCIESQVQGFQSVLSPCGSSGTTDPPCVCKLTGRISLLIS